MSNFPGTQPNFHNPSPLSLEELGQFVSTRETYLETNDPIRTLQYAFMDEATELMQAIPKNPDDPYDHENLKEELGDNVIMSVLVARNQSIELSDIVPFSTIEQFQASLSPAETYGWQGFGVAFMNVYVNIDQNYHRNEDAPNTATALRTFLEQVAGIATAHDIQLADALHHTMAKLEKRTRPNHSVDAADKPERPQTHTGRYLHKVGALGLHDIVASEQSLHL